MKVKKITHYQKDDEDFIKDFCSVEIFIDGMKTKHYGDWHHDKGEVKAEAYIDAITDLISNANVERVKKATGEMKVRSD